MNNQTITVKLHDAKKVISTLNVTKTPDQPVIIQAKKNVNYELLDDATQFAPENIKIKRVGNDLHIGLEDGSSDPLDADLIIQDYYGQDGTTTNLLIGLHENGSYYAYVPESGLQEHAVSMLADEVSAGQALGGEPLVAAAYEFNPYWLLALIPLAGLAAAGGGSSSNTGENVKDTIAPAAPVIDPIAVGNDTTPEITGTAEPNSTVTVVIKDNQGNVVVEDEVAVDPTGNWSYTPDTALPEGKNEVVATATDAAGNTSNPSTPVELVVDITPPAAPVIDPIAVGNDTTPEITGTAEPNSTVTVVIKDDQGNVVVEDEVAVDPTGNWSYTPDTALPEGKNEVVATATDAAGNTSNPSTPVELVVDITPPAAPVIDPIAVGNDTTPEITGTAEPNSTVTVVIKDDQGNVVVEDEVAVDPTGNWSYTPDTALPEGKNEVVATATDAAGNTSNPSTPVELVVDITPPAAPVIDPIAVGNDTTPEITGTAEPNSTVTVVIKDNQGNVVVEDEVAVDPTGNWSYTPDTALPEGKNEVVATATDAAGNSSVPATDSGNIDTTAPTAGSLSAPDNIADTTPTITGSGAEPNVSITVTVTDNLGVVQTLTTTADGLGNYSVTPATPLAEGSYTASAIATDAAGNPSVPATDSGNIDTTAPDVTTGPTALTIDPVTTDNILNAAESSGTVTLTGSLSNIPADAATTGVTVTVNGVNYTAAVTGTTWSTDVPGSSLLNDPDLTVDATATFTDPAGNTSTVSDSQLYSIDTTAPTAGSLSAPDNIADTTPTITGSGAEPNVSITVTVTDNLGVVQTLTTTADGLGNYSVTPATPLAEGSYTASAIATDAAGNPSVPATDSGNIDTTAPDVTTGPTALTIDPVTTDNILNAAESSGTVTLTGSLSNIPADAATTGVTVTVNGVNYTAAVTGTTWSTDVPGSSLLNDPDLTVDATATFTDPAGNTSTVSDSQLYSIDTTAPTAGSLSAPDNIADTTPTITGSGAEPNVSITVTVTDNLGVVQTLTTTADGLGNYSVTPATPLAEGSYTASAIATDAAGNPSVPATDSGNIDTTAPDVTTGPTALTIDPVTTDNILNAAESSGTVTLTGSLSNIPADAATTGVTVTVNGVNYTAAVTGTTWSTDVPGSSLLNDPDLTVDATATFTDPAGNTSTVSDSQLYSIDTTAPTAGSLSAPDNIADTTPTITGSGAEPNVSITVTVTDNLGVVQTLTTTADGLGNYSVTPATPLAEGSYTASAIATDAAGNPSVPATDSGNIDTTAPDVTTGPTALTIDPVTTDNILNAAESSGTVTLTGSLSNIPADAATTGVTVTVNGVNYTAAVTGTTWSTDVPGSSLLNDPDLTVDATATFTDPAGNTSTVSDSQLYSIDTTAPTAGSLSAPDNIADTTPTITGSGAEPNVSITVTVTDNLGVVQTLTTTADGLGNYSVTPATPLAEGSYTASAIATDAAGNPSVPATDSGNIDTTAPDVTTGPTALTIDPVTTDNILNAAESSGTVTLTGSLSNIPADAATTGVTVTVNGVNYTAAVTGTTWSTDVPGSSLLNDPDLTVDATATFTDPAGNTSTVSDSQLYSIDTTAPTAGSLSAPDNIADTTPTITGSGAEPNVSITVTVTDNLGVVQTLTTTADGLGNYSVTPATPLAEGSYTASAIATDAAGNPSVPATDSGNIDTTAPDVTTGPTALTIDPVTTDNILNAAESSGTVTLTGSLSNIPADAATTGVTVTVNGVNYTAAVTGTTWSTDVPGSSLLNDPDLTVDATATFTDPAGNTSTVSDSQLYSIDTTAPTAGSLSAPDNIADTTPTITGSGAEPNVSITVTVTDNLGVVQTLTTTADGLGNYSVTPATPLAEGSYTASAIATDAAGNPSVPATDSGNIDTTAPDVTTGPTALTIDPVTTDNILNAAESSGTVTLTGSLSNIPADAATTGVTVTVNGVNYTAAVTGTTWSTDVPGSSLLNDPDLTVDATATFTDPAGNTSTVSDSQLYSIDTTAPTAGSLSAPDNIADTTPTITGSGAEPNVSITVTVTDNLGVVQTLTTTADGLGNYSVTPATPLAEGSYTASAIATDAAGNPSVPATDSGNIDTTAPDVTTGPTALTIDPVTTDNILNAAESSGTVTLTGSLSNIPADAATTGVTVTVNGVNYTAAVTGTTWSTDVPGSSLLNDPDLTVDATATFTDPAGNTSTVSDSQLYSIDTTAPTAGSLSAPDNIADTTPTITGSGAEPNVSITVTVTDNLGVVQTLTTTADGLGNYSVTPATPLAEGSYTASAIATDAAGNPSVPATDSGNIDTTAPDVTTGPTALTIDPVTTDNILNAAESSGTVTLTGSLSNIPADAATTGVTVTVNGVNYTAAVTGTTWSTDVPGSSLLNDPDLTVDATATFTDPAGNTSTVSDSQLYSIDTTAPTAGSLSAPDNIADTTPTITGSGAEPNVSITVTVTDNLGVVQTLTTTADGLGNYSVTPVTPLAEGSYTASAIATDAAGNPSVPATDSGNIDTTAPDVTTGPTALTIDPVTTDNILNAAESSGTVTLTGSLSNIPADAATTGVTVTVNGVNYTAAVTGTTWSTDVPGSSLLNDPDLTVDATATFTDPAGNTSTVSDSQLYSIDTTAPTAGSLSAPDNIADTTPTITGSGAEPNVSITVTVTDNLGVVQTLTTTADGLGNYSVTPATPLAEGSYTASAIATDAAGNPSVPATDSGNIDTTAPDVTTGPTALTIDPVTTDNILNAAESSGTVTLTGSLSNIPADAATTGVTVTVNGVNYTAAVTGTTWSTDVPGSSLLNDPDLTVDATATFTDPAGNTSTVSDSQLYSIDTTAPTAGSLSAPDNIADTTPTITGSGAEPNVSITVTVTDNLGVVQTLTTTADGLGNYSVTPATPLAEGSYTASAIATDAAGNPSVPATDSGNIDTTAPDVTTGPTALTIDPVTTDNILNAAESSGTVTLTGSLSNIPADAATTGVTVTVNGVNYTAAVTGTTWSTDVPGSSLLNDPDLTVDATATFTDPAGNTSTVSDSQLYSIDTTAPTAGSLSAPDNIADTTPTITGSGAEPNVSITVTVTDNLGVVQTLTTTADGLGNYSVTPATPLAEGSYTASAIATDAAGNPSVPATDSGNIDTTAPDVTTGPTALTIDPVTTDNILNAAESSGTVTLTGSLSNIPADAATTGVTVTVNGVNYTAAVTGTTWSTDVPGSSLLNDPDLTVDATATFTDPAGNTSTVSDSQLYSIDTTAPTAGSLSAPDNIADTTPTITGSGAEPNVSITVTVTDNLGVVQTLTTTADGLGNYSVTPATPLAEGSYTASAIATDAAGNPSVPATDSGNIDTTAPDVTTGPTALTIDPVTTDNILNAAESSGTVTLTGSLSNIPADAATTGVTVTVNGVNYTAAVTGTTWSTDVPGSSLLNDPDLTVDATATFTDPAGNTSTVSDSQLYSIDTTADNNANGATVAISAIITDTGVTGDFITNDPTLVISGTVDLADDNTLSVSANGTTYNVNDGFLSVDALGNWSLDLTGTTLTAGTYPVVATVTDLAGNTSTATQDIVINQPPIVVNTLVSVSEEGLLGGSADTLGSPDTTNAKEFTGTMTFSDPDTTIASVSVIGPSGIKSGGIDVLWSGSFSAGTYTLTGVTGSTTVATLTLATSGAYTFNLLAPLDHLVGGIEDILALNFAVTATDSEDAVGSGQLTVNVEDDMPVAADVTLYEFTVLPASASGDLSVTYGADGGRVESIGIDGYFLTFDPVANSIIQSGSSELVYDHLYNATNNTLTLRTVKGETFVFDMYTGVYTYNAGAPLIAPETQVAPVVTLGNDSLLGLVGVSALGLIDFSQSQLFAATDVNNNIKSVTIRITALTISLGAGFEVAGGLTMANQLGLTYNNNNTMGVLDGIAEITISSLDGGAIDNQRLNELLGAVYFNTGLLNIGLLSTVTISATDTTNLTSTLSDSNVLNLGLLSSSAPAYLDLGTASGETLTGTDGSDRMYGYAGNDTLNAGAGADILRGGAGNDVLNGGDGNDVLIGGAGDDSLTGGSGNDVFMWELGDQSATPGSATAANDTINDFNIAPVSSGGDLIDLGNLLQGEGKIGTDPGNLIRYLHFSYDGTNTVLYISSNGSFSGGYDAVNDPANVDQIITFNGVDLRQGLMTDHDIIENLLSNGNLIVDEATSTTNMLGSTTIIDAVITDNDGDTASTQVIFDSTGATLPSPVPVPGNVAPVVQANDSTLLGLIGAEALTIIDLSQQDLVAGDVNGNLKTVEIAYQPLLSVNLIPLQLTASTKLAAELGLTFTVKNDPGLLGLVAPSSVLTITAVDGGEIDNLAINEFLATVKFGDTTQLLGLNVNLRVAVLDAMTIKATDSYGLTASDSLGNLADLSALHTLLGTNSPIIEGTTGNDLMFTGTAGNERLYGYGGNDTISGGGGNDLIRGGAGDDVLNGDTGNDLLIDGNGYDTIDGGSGNDTIMISGTGFESVDGGLGTDTLILLGGIDLDVSLHNNITSIEKIDLSNDINGSKLTLTAQDVLDISDTDILAIYGDAADEVTLVTGAIQGAVITDANDVTMTEYTWNGSNAKILVDNDIVAAGGVIII